MDDTEQAAFSWPVRVYFEDTDSGGVVYYANYLKFLERARSEWLRSLGFEQDQLLREQQLVFMVRSVNIDYHAPARFNDLLRVQSWLTRCRRVSVEFTQQVLRSQQLLCTAKVEVACVDAQRLKPKQLPEQLIAGLNGGG